MLGIFRDKEVVDDFIKLLDIFDKSEERRFLVNHDLCEKHKIKNLHRILYYANKDQIIEFDTRSYRFIITDLISLNGSIKGFYIEKCKAELKLYNELTDHDVSLIIDKKSKGNKLAVGSICINSSGKCVRVKSIEKKKVIDSKATNDDKNNPTGKDIYKDDIFVIYNKELNSFKDFSTADDETNIEQFTSSYVITPYTKLSDANGVDINALMISMNQYDINDDGEEQSSNLVSTTNTDYLNQLSKSLDIKHDKVSMLRYMMDRNIAIKKYELEQILEKQKADLQGIYDKANELIESFRKQLTKIEKLIITLEIYMGIHEELIQISEGEKADDSEEIKLLQQVYYMDEEYGDPTDGGLDFTQIDQFDAWLVENRNFERIIQCKKGVRILQVRRNEKQRSSDLHPIMKAKFEKLDRKIYVLIRNGDNLYRIWSDHIDVINKLFPSKDELQNIIDSINSDKDWKNKYFRPKSDEEKHEMIKEEIDDFMFYYKRLMLMISGLIFRTEILNPIPQGLDIFKPETYDKKLQFIYDDEPSLSDGKMTFKDWQKELNENIKKGSRVILAINDMGDGYRSKDYVDRFNINIEHSVPPLPDKDIYTISTYKKEKTRDVTRIVDSKEFKKIEYEILNSDNEDLKSACIYNGKLNYRRSFWEIPKDIKSRYEHDYDIPQNIREEYTFYEIYEYEEKYEKDYRRKREQYIHEMLCVRYNPKDKVYAGWGKEFDEGYSRERKANLTFLVYKDDKFIINYDLLDINDIDYFINNRFERKNYLHVLPLLWTLRKQIIAEMKWESEFVDFTEKEIKKEIIDVANIDIKPFIRKAIDWWKNDLARVWKRAITKDEKQALQAIKQESKRLIRDELKLKIDTGVDNRKKILVYSFKGKFENTKFICTNMTKAEFINNIIEDSNVYYALLRKTISKASISKAISESNSEEYKILLEKSNFVKI